MRRLLAITVISALICSTGMPVWAQVCATMQKTPLCHRMPAQSAKKTMPNHHCDSMAMPMEDAQDAALPPGSTAVLEGGSHDCPMQCCTQATARAGFAIPATVFMPTLAPSQNQIDFPTVVFLSAGFSSHTDRGPPRA